MTACFEPRRFRSTVPYYARYRVPYPAPLISFVHERCGLRAGSRVLDLGCGPGQLAVAFATLGCAVTAMDPEPEMLAAMKQRAIAADASIEAIRASSHDLDGSFGHFDLVAMGRSFHWMERDETLNRLNEIVAPTGAVVLLGDRRISTPGVDWPAVVDRLAEVFAPARAAERRERRSSARESHEEVLLRSPFRHLERYGIVLSQTLNAYEVVGRSFSMSATSPEALGSRQKDFESELHAELVRLSPNALFHEVVEANALIATREVRKSPTEESRNTETNNVLFAALESDPERRRSSAGGGDVHSIRSRPFHQSVRDEHVACGSRQRDLSRGYIRLDRECDSSLSRFARWN